MRDGFVFNNISLEVSGPCVDTAAETWHGTGNKREKWASPHGRVELKRKEKKRLSASCLAAFPFNYVSTNRSTQFETKQMSSHYCFLLNQKVMWHWYYSGAAVTRFFCSSTWPRRATGGRPNLLHWITLTDRMIVDKQLDSMPAPPRPSPHLCTARRSCVDLPGALLDDNRASSLTFIVP